MEEERNQALHSLHQERTTRQSLDLQLADLRQQLTALTINYNRLLNPVEQVDCDVTMQHETDVAILRLALQEKLGNLVVVSQKLDEDRNRLGNMEETIRDLQSQKCALSELVKKGQEVGIGVVRC